MGEFVFKIPENQTPETYKKMRQRWAKWAPVRSAVQAAFLAKQREYYTRTPIGKMENLGPKILSGDYVHARGKSITLGAASTYGGAYEKWREKHNLGPLFLVDQQLTQTVIDIIYAFVILGHGASPQAPRKRRSNKK